MATKTVQDLVVPVGVTLDRFIMHSQSAFPYATGELSQLLRDIALAGKIINREINRAGLIDIAGGNGTENVQGEDQQKLDIVANVRFIRALKNGERSVRSFPKKRRILYIPATTTGSTWWPWTRWMVLPISM
jgi:fructose-1,6-bisphosphatase I